MIDPERLLGGMVRGALRGGGRRNRRRVRRLAGGRGVTGAALGMGALGVAIAAFEHFSSKGDGAERFTGGDRSAPPATPPLPPPPPGATGAVPPPPPPGSSEAVDAGQEAMLLVRAMIAAANADHDVDADERARVLEALEEGGLEEEERAAVAGELESPWSIERLAGEATTPELAREVYLASLLAIQVDTVAEANYLARLARALGLDEDAVAQVESMVESAE